MAEQLLETTCCIAGGGPAGMMLGLLLARAGVAVIVLEKHGDFLRDFRGDTIHPSTLEVMHELGLAEELFRLPHQKAPELTGQVGRATGTLADFRHLPVRSPFIALMPQWDFLNFLARHAARHANFRLLLDTSAEGLIEEGGQVRGIRARHEKEAIEIRADLVIGADGRHSTVRERAGLAVEVLGAPMDVLWFRLPRHEGDPSTTTGRFESGRIFVQIHRGDYWQCGYVIPKGSFEGLKAKGLQAFQGEVASISGLPLHRLAEIADWDQVKLLTVAVDRLRQWHRPGLLCIGDAAHAMSPVGGVGINLAIQDAVATANLLWQPLRERRLTDEDLARVQQRRALPTRLTQGLQVTIQKRIVARVLASDHPFATPLPVRLLFRYPFLRRIPARLLGLGFRPEHVHSPEAAPPRGT
jgi:2-polyprenyl-6-methoxyphenol hydroxylase-like FAD-dependent oxidoreductase